MLHIPTPIHMHTLSFRHRHKKTQASFDQQCLDLFSVQVRGRASERAHCVLNATVHGCSVLQRACRLDVLLGRIQRRPCARGGVNPLTRRRRPHPLFRHPSVPCHAAPRCTACCISRPAQPSMAAPAAAPVHISPGWAARLSASALAAGAFRAAAVGALHLHRLLHDR